ncbi:MAG: phosphoribosylanthranilate isomerase [Anaerolineales bacterium]
MKVKICGMTDREEALAAVEAGADLLGFNFYPPSPRFIETQVCREIVAELRRRGCQATMVGVFVNASPESIRQTLQICHLDLAQLSGNEPVSQLKALNGRGFKALRPRTIQAARDMALRFARPAAPALLLDAHHPELFGGTGRTGDWPAARTLAEDYPLLLAGGLKPENVAQAIRAVRPWGVDVASGVESSPGRKDITKMRAFISAARQAQEEISVC